MEMNLSHTAIRKRTALENWQNVTQQDLAAQQDMAELEQKLCEYVGVPYCVSVESATAGMLFALKACDVGIGDTVLCTNFSYLATVEIVALTGAKALLVDINPNTYNMDPYCLEYVINKCVRMRQPLPKALIAVDLFGLPCNYEAIGEICSRYGIQMIEDMAQSFGAEFHGKRTGGFGRMAVASFFPAKPLDELGEGGAVFCHTEQDMQRLRSLRKNIRLQQAQKALYNAGGYLDPVQASIVTEKLESMELEMECRHLVAEQYVRRLDSVVHLQQVGEEYRSAYTQFVISLPDVDCRNQMLEYLQERHVPCQIFNPSPLQRHNRDSVGEKSMMVNTKSVAQKILALPIHPYLSRRVVDYICDCVIEGLEQLTKQLSESSIALECEEQ